MFQHKINNLFQDCQPGSLDTVNLPILLQTANNSSFCLSEARCAFNRTYRNANFYIEPFTGGFYEYKKQTVRIKNFNMTRNILQRFGDFMQFIDITFESVNETENMEIVRLINDNCTESLIQLHLRNCYGSVLDGLKKPYRKVNKATFSTNLLVEFNVSTSTQTLDQLFPSLKYLDVSITITNDWKFVGNNLPKLRSLSVAFPKLSDPYEPNVESLLDNSPNLTSLAINNGSLWILSAASVRLTNLKLLRIYAISNDNYEGDDIHFEHVTRLYMRIFQNMQRIPEKLVFHKLKIMELDLRFELTDQWIQFFEKQPNQTVEYFYLNAKSIAQKQLATVAKHQPNIMWANINTSTKISPDAIVDFIDRSEHLFVLSLMIFNDSYDIFERNYFDVKLQHNWSILAESTGFVR